MDSKEPLTHTNNSSMEITQSLDEDALIDGPLISPDILDSAIKKEFQKLPTSWAALLLSFVHVSFVCLSVVLATYCSILQSHKSQCREYLQDLGPRPVIVIAKVCLWLLLLVFERYVQRHHGQVRSRGYLQFYRATRNLKTLPVYIHSTGNAAVLLVLAVAPLCAELLSVSLLLGILGLELLSVPCLLLYSVKVQNFNRDRPEPDVSQEERSHGYHSNIHPLSTETGFRDGSNLEDVVEKQADLIEYLKQHNTLLSKRILSMTSQQMRE